MIAMPPSPSGVAIAAMVSSRFNSINGDRFRPRFRRHGLRARDALCRSFVCEGSEAIAGRWFLEVEREGCRFARKEAKDLVSWWRCASFALPDLNLLMRRESAARCRSLERCNPLRKSGQRGV